MKRYLIRNLLTSNYFVGPAPMSKSKSPVYGFTSQPGAAYVFDTEYMATLTVTKLLQEDKYLLEIVPVYGIK